MAVAYVKDTGVKTATNFATTTGSFATLPVVGNHVIVGISDYNASSEGMDAVTDNQSNSYAEDADKFTASGARGAAAIYSCKVATSSGTFTLTIDPTGASSNYAAWSAVEFSGLDATTWKDQTGTNSGAGTGDATVTASGANSTADGVSLAVTLVDNNDTDINIGDTPPTGYTQISVYENAQSIVGHSFVYKIYSASETSSASWTHDNTSQNGWEAALVTYKAAAGGGGGGTAVPVFYKHRQEQGMS